MNRNMRWMLGAMTAIGLAAVGVPANAVDNVGGPDLCELVDPCPGPGDVQIPSGETWVGAQKTSDCRAFHLGYSDNAGVAVVTNMGENRYTAVAELFGCRNFIGTCEGVENKYGDIVGVCSDESTWLFRYRYSAATPEGIPYDAYLFRLATTDGKIIRGFLATAHAGG